MKKLLLLVYLLLVGMIYSNGDFSVNVLDASVKGQVVKGAKVTFIKGRQKVEAGYTDEHGRIVLEDGIFGGIDNSSIKIRIEKEGYATLETKGPFNGLTFALSKKMEELDGFRVVLSWGENPQDIDSHLTFNGVDVYYGNKVEEKTNLDVDDTDGFGPETITIEKTLMGTEYIYAVHDYTNQGDTFSEKLSESDAKVIVYIGETQIETFYIPQGKIGNLWVLFKINGYDELKVINKFTTTHSVEETQSLLKDILADSTVLDKKIATDAKKLNTKGEAAYREKNYDSAIEYFEKAIAVKANYSQAYSNLGLTYQKEGKLAEAIWANRKAISLAGDSKRVKASSYYNIAKIFEGRGEWEDALENYKWALENREHDAYKKGIKRMEDKLNQ